MKRETDCVAFSLVEVTIALAVASFCLLILVALLPAGINMNHNSFAQTVGINLSTSIAADLEATATNCATTPTNCTSPIYSVTIVAPQTGSSSTKTLYMQDNGSFGTTTASGPFRVTVTTKGPGATNPHAATTARIYVTWPAPANPLTGRPDAVDTLISLNRN
jgi:hypothetical protein